MTALLEVPEIRERVSPISVAEYHQLGEFNENGRRTELIRGILIEKISKSPLHCFIAAELRRMIESQVSPSFTVFYQDPITTADSEPEPDVMVVRGDRKEFRMALPTTAELAIEVAISSVKLDRVKAHIYAEWSASLRARFLRLQASLSVHTETRAERRVPPCVPRGCLISERLHSDLKCPRTCGRRGRSGASARTRCSWAA